MIGIINYGLGNVQAIENVYKRLLISVKIVESAGELKNCTKLILPGVGAFDHAMLEFEKSGMRPDISELVINKNIPLLGICVGMQMLASSSEEGACQGLSWVPGRVRSLKNLMTDKRLPLPHMGWNDVAVKTDSPLFKGLENQSRFYFLHSFYFECEKQENIAAEVEYGSNFTCAVLNKNIFGVQFHPEKSHQFGVTLLKNFAELC